MLDAFSLFARFQHNELSLLHLCNEFFFWRIIIWFGTPWVHLSCYVSDAQNITPLAGSNLSKLGPESYWHDSNKTFKACLAVWFDKMFHLVHFLPQTHRPSFLQRSKVRIF